MCHNTLPLTIKVLQSRILIDLTRVVYYEAHDFSVFWIIQEIILPVLKHIAIITALAPLRRLGSPGLQVARLGRARRSPGGGPGLLGAEWPRSEFIQFRTLPRISGQRDVPLEVLTG